MGTRGLTVRDLGRHVVRDVGLGDAVHEVGLSSDEDERSAGSQQRNKKREVR